MGVGTGAFGGAAAGLAGGVAAAVDGSGTAGLSAKGFGSPSGVDGEGDLVSSVIPRLKPTTQKGFGENVNFYQLERALSTATLNANDAVAACRRSELFLHGGPRSLYREVWHCYHARKIRDLYPVEDPADKTGDCKRYSKDWNHAGDIEHSHGNPQRLPRLPLHLDNSS